MRISFLATAGLFFVALLLSSPTSTVFAQAKESWMEYKMPYIGEQNDISNPNKTEEEILNWAQETVTHTLTLTPENINQKILESKKNFDKKGWSDFSKYANETNLVNVVKTRGFNISTIFNGTGMVMDGRSMQGAYRWLIEAPLMMSFQRPDAVSGNIETVGNSNYRLVMQVGRKKEKEFPDGLAIEAWKVERIKTK